MKLSQLQEARDATTPPSVEKIKAVISNMPRERQNPPISLEFRNGLEIVEFFNRAFGDGQFKHATNSWIWDLPFGREVSLDYYPNAWPEPSSVIHIK